MIPDLSSKLKQLRIHNNLSREQVAQLLGMSRSQIGFYECGTRTPTLSVLIKLCTLYKTSADYLLNINVDTHKQMSLEGLTDKQIKVLIDTAKCFRNPE